MKPTFLTFVLLMAVTIVATQAWSGSHELEAQEDKGVILYSYRGNYRMSPEPTLHSDLARIQVQSVELLNGPEDKPVTKITYKPLYGKIDVESAAFRTKHETQQVSMLVNGDHTTAVRKGDVLRSCYYPN